jgi:hypothetical protein
MKTFKHMILTACMLKRNIKAALGKELFVKPDMI